MALYVAYPNSNLYERCIVEKASSKDQSTYSVKTLAEKKENAPTAANNRNDRMAGQRRRRGADMMRRRMQEHDDDDNEGL